ncbi:MAG: NAD-dependent epimerase/dehydratase family protein [Gemmatimonadota bacterium]|nr:NAD-dependent epimerase/dehydratase family protein [Gemmatimonadota bacterium]
MQGKKVLITGGAGLIGSHIADRLVKLGAEQVVIYDSFVRGTKENLAWALEHVPLTVIEADIRDTGKLARAMQGMDLVFHQAALRITQCAEQPGLALEVLADGTFNVLDEARKAGVKKVVAASSASVYGAADLFPTAEDHHPYNNRTIYGAAKAFNEGLLRSFHEMYGLDYVALRYFNVYGPRMDMHGAYTEVLIRWVQRIREELPPLILGDGSQTMDFIYVEDIAEANILAAQAGVTDEVFNIGSGTETSLNDLARILLKVMGSDLGPEYGPQRKVNPVPRRLADTAKAKRLLGFKARTGLEQGLRNLVDYIIPDPGRIP